MNQPSTDNATAGQPGVDAPLPEAPEPCKSKRASWNDVARVRSGLTVERFGLGLSRTGRRSIHAWHAATKLRRELEDECRKRSGGKLGLLDVARIQSVCRLEINCRSYERLLKEQENMPVEDQRAMREAVCRWSAQRDNLIAELLSDRPAGGVDWSGMDWRRG